MNLAECEVILSETENTEFTNSEFVIGEFELHVGLLLGRCRV